MEYRITEVFDVVPAQWGKQRVGFKVDGNPNKLSGFFLHVPKVGDTLNGEVVRKGSYWNFSFGQKAPPMQNTVGVAEIKNLIEFKLMARIDRLEYLLEKLAGMEPEEPKMPYPPMTKSNDASGFGEGGVIEQNNPF